jgi:hypothetical protein
LSFAKEIYTPDVIGAQNILIRVSLDKINWPASRWETLAETYPYALQRDDNSEELVKFLGTKTPIIRGDWFLTHSLNAPLYYKLLRLPSTQSELELLQGITWEQKYRQTAGGTSQQIRAGFLNSGVSSFNRTIERLESNFGAFWKSYDFGSEGQEKSVLTSPLGPGNIGIINETKEKYDMGSNAIRNIFN